MIRSTMGAGQPLSRNGTAISSERRAPTEDRTSERLLPTTPQKAERDLPLCAGTRSEGLYHWRSNALELAEDFAPLPIEAFVRLSDLLLEFGKGFVQLLLQLFAFFLDFVRLVFHDSFALKLILSLSQLPL